MRVDLSTWLYLPLQDEVKAISHLGFEPWVRQHKKTIEVSVGNEAFGSDWTLTGLGHCRALVSLCRPDCNFWVLLYMLSRFSEFSTRILEGM